MGKRNVKKISVPYRTFGRKNQEEPKKLLRKTKHLSNMKETAITEMKKKGHAKFKETQFIQLQSLQIPKSKQPLRFLKKLLWLTLSTKPKTAPKILSLSSYNFKMPKSKQPLRFLKKLLSLALSTKPKTTPKILNLSSYNFKNIQLSVLRHITKFTSIRSRSLLSYKNDLSNFTKKNQMKEIFNDTEYQNE